MRVNEAGLLPKCLCGLHCSFLLSNFSISSLWQLPFDLMSMLCRWCCINCYNFCSFSGLWWLLFEICETNEPQNSKACSGVQGAGDRWRLQHPRCNVSTHEHPFLKLTWLSKTLDVFCDCYSKYTKSFCMNYSLASPCGKGVCSAQTPERHGSKNWWRRLMLRKTRNSPKTRWVIIDVFAHFFQVLCV